MPFRITMRPPDVQRALTDQGYTADRAGRLDHLDAAVSSRATPGAAMDLTPGGETKVRAQIDGELTERGYTAPRAGNLDRLDATISSRAAPGAAMDIVAAARAAIWNELIPATPAAGSYGERVRNNLDTTVSSRADAAHYTSARAGLLDRLDATVSSRAAPGAAMDIVAGARAAIWNETIPTTPAAGSYGERINTNLDVSVGTRATPGDVDSVIAGRGLTLARMAKLDTIQAQVRATGNVTAANNTAGLTVTLDGNYRTVIEVRYSCGAAAEFFVEGSDDGTTWWEGDRFSEAAAVTDGIVGYLTARRFTRMRSPTTGIDLSFELVALL